VGRDYRSIAAYDLLRTLPFGLIGIAVGLYVFTALDAGTLARGLGLLVVAYGVHALWTSRPGAGQQSAAGAQSSTGTLLSQRLLAPIAGILGGAVGTTFGTMASIFYAIYFDAIRLAKHQFRATMSAMILTLSLVRGLGYFVVGEFGLEALKTFALFFPLMLIGVFAGDRFHGGIGETAFRRLVAAVLIVSGLALLVK